MFAIYNSMGIGENRGGPQGYLYQLNAGFKENEFNITILSDFSPAQLNKKSRESFVSSEKKTSVITETIRSILHFYKIGYLIKKNKKNNFNRYDVLHVHSSEDVYYLRRILGYKGKIIFTSHKPESLADEKVSALKLRLGIDKKFSFLYIFYNQIEKKAYKYSDAYIFPSEHAKKIYNSFPGFIKYSAGKPVQYVFTGCSKKSLTIDRDAYRKQHGIDKNSFMVSYVGRHNFIKGYDLLSNIGEKLIDKGIVVVCAGAVSTIDYPKCNNWKELGYISDVQNLINASDVVVIPNRNTYFDLVIIEILSEGKIVVTSETGGNIDISKYTDGLILFEAGNSASLFESICKVKNLNSEERSNLELQNLSFYENNCAVKIFAKKYLDAVNLILSELGENQIEIS